MSKITSKQRDTIVIAHDLNTVLTALANKSNTEAGVTKEDLAVLPNLVRYSSRLMGDLLDEMTEAAPEPEDAPEEAPQSEQVHEGPVV